MSALKDGETFVGGRSREKARELLALADAAGVDQRLVRATIGGYIVPTSILAAPEPQDEVVEEEILDEETSEQAKGIEEQTEAPSEPVEDVKEPEPVKVQPAPPARGSRAKKKES